MTTLLSLSGVAMSYATASNHEGGAHKVLRGIDLELCAGERLGVVGTNGTGKSTLLRVMAKIFAPAQGQVHWAPGASVALLSLGLGFREDLTGRENAYLATMLQGYGRRDAKALLAKISEFVELGDYFDEPVKTYSSGMRARLGFATALLNNASVLLIDEVLGVGDAHFRDKARETLLEQLSPERGVVLVSHNPQMIKNLCTRAIWLDQGSVRADGDPNQVLEAYSGNNQPRAGSKVS
jgi:lipopolysaccharide transport system ATP-binding protein